MSESELLLLSGGLDSTAIASIREPNVALFVDYGQRPSRGELRASRAVASYLGIPFRSISVDLSQLGGGLLLDELPLPNAPSPEWWPFRNQFLATIGAAIAVQNGLERVVIGSVKGDGDRHVDGTSEFYEQLDRLISVQEGGIRVTAPYLETTTAELVERSGRGMELFGWTISCHRADMPCFSCPGCNKRGSVLSEVGLLRGGGVGGETNTVQ